MLASAANSWLKVAGVAVADVSRSDVAVVVVVADVLLTSSESDATTLEQTLLLT